MNFPVSYTYIYSTTSGWAFWFLTTCKALWHCYSRHFAILLSCKWIMVLDKGLLLLELDRVAWNSISCWSSFSLQVCTKWLSFVFLNYFEFSQFFFTLLFFGVYMQIFTYIFFLSWRLNSSFKHIVSGLVWIMNSVKFFYNVSCALRPKALEALEPWDYVVWH